MRPEIVDGNGHLGRHRRGSRKGILIKGGNYIENLADIDTVVLDKTGTITMGVPQIDHIETVEASTIRK